MAKKYPEKVSARMIRIIEQGEVYLIRHSTFIQFGTSSSLIGTVFMTNPGSFDFKNSSGWEDFKNGKGDVNIFSGEDYPDLTMQNIIEVVRESYKAANLGAPDGVVQIINLTNVVQSKKDKVEDYYQKVKRLINERGLDQALLTDVTTTDQQAFLDTCEKSKFVIMGFADKVFSEKVLTMKHWSHLVSNKLVVALDKKNRFSHPRRWRTDKDLKERAIEKMAQVLGDG